MKGSIKVLTKEGAIIEHEEFKNRYHYLSMLSDAMETYPDHLIEINILSKA